MTLAKKFRCVVAVLATAFSLQSAAQSLPSVSNCDGAGMLVCAPFVAAAIAKKALVRGSSENRLAEALKEGDAAKAKKLLKKRMRRADEEKVYYLNLATDAYLKDVNPAKESARREIVSYILANIDLRGANGAAFLQRLLGLNLYTSQAEYVRRRLALAHIAFAQGATARGVSLGRCEYCEIDQEILPLLVSHGADPNTGGFLLTFLVDRSYDAAARQLIGLGADPNGRIEEWRGPLHHLAERCTRREMQENLAPKEFERIWQQCVESTTDYARFAIGHGADPNGQSSVASLCDTPYSLALQAGNKVLAQTLKELGADPGLAQRCRESAPPGTQL